MIPVGSNTTHTVYAAELVGIDTALNQMLAHQDAFSDVNPNSKYGYPYRQPGRDTSLPGPPEVIWAVHCQTHC